MRNLKTKPNLVIVKRVKRTVKNREFKVKTKNLRELAELIN